ncbi:ADP-ribose pyrophosphatase [Cyanobium sp. Copco_Reservoir_LC18]|uniref:NUDIX hydrolase n=1 Tax=Cyanobium sp. Copco_Reservoir_LC18 TaxID=1328305 RepID=UPI001356F4AC|nr:NUDIX hydrolase [Cyanobium sp. Copco_Reservoir_LC18]KAF0653675.1 ADP-ribose pyrophosphatase [Cyanobium sp. Copco_Reservoir_LC18]
MTFAVALAMLEREGRWLLQLRDDIEGIVHPGCWGLFGGHLDPGERPEQAILRELREEIGWGAPPLPLWFEHHDDQLSAYYFRGPLTVSLTALRLNEGQDLALAGLEELRSGRIWSPRLQQRRGLAPSLERAVRRLDPGLDRKN